MLKNCRKFNLWKIIIYLNVELIFLGRLPYKYSWNFNDVVEVSNKAKDFEEEKYRFQIINNGELDGIKYQINGIFKTTLSNKRFEVFNRYFSNSKSICIQESNSLITEFFLSEKNYKISISKTENAFKKFRWRFELLLNKNVSEGLNFSYSLNGINWFPIVNIPSISGMWGGIYEKSNDEKLIHKYAKDFFETCLEEPVYVDMIREANLIIYPNYKSAFAIAIAALEIATKEFIIKKIDNTRKLIYGFPSPDLFKLISQIIPEIEVKFKLKEDIEKKIKTMMVKRNELVHKGYLEDDYAIISDYVRIINNLILLLDYYSGFDWLDIQNARELLK